jgi:DNA polymerase-3 subunit delta'
VVTVFDDVIGHRPTLEMLAAGAGRPSHAYLFVGPASVGKATVARRFAASVLCGDDAGCIRRVLGDTHPDLMLVEPDGRTALTVQRARETVARAVLTPVEADHKVFVFEEAGAMNDEAANALLKTLEEPTPTTVFILVAESEDELPSTVASRARTILFGRVPDAEIATALVRRGVEADQAERAAAASGGRPGLALMLATRPEVAAFRTAWLSVPRRVSAHPGDAFRLADELIAAADPLLAGLTDRQGAELDRAEEEGRETRAIRERHERERKRAASALHVGGLEILASWYRDAAAAQFGAPIRNRDLSGADLAEVSPPIAVARARRVLDTIDSLDVNQRPELAFSALFADLGTPA